jgi:hypothetical protein
LSALKDGEFVRRSEDRRGGPDPSPDNFGESGWAVLPSAGRKTTRQAGFVADFNLKVQSGFFAH